MYVNPKRNPNAKYDSPALTYLMAGRGREPNAETDKLFTSAILLARGKSAKMLGQTLGPIPLIHFYRRGP